MNVVVDLTSGDVSLEDAGEFQGFAVVALRREPADGPDNGALGAVAGALSEADCGSVELAGDALIPAAAVRRLAGTTDEAWEASFVSMLDYAATKGWLTDDGSIRAHVEWRD